MAKKQKHGNWIAGLMRNYRLTSLLIIMLFVFGLYGLDQMPKDSFPTFTIRQGVVVAIYPGASAEEYTTSGGDRPALSQTGAETRN